MRKGYILSVTHQGAALDQEAQSGFDDAIALFSVSGVWSFVRCSLWFVHIYITFTVFLLLCIFHSLSIFSVNTASSFFSA